MKNLIQCNNGHYYDANEYAFCPYCAQANNDQEYTTTMDEGSNNDVFSTTVVQGGGYTTGTYTDTFGANTIVDNNVGTNVANTSYTPTEEPQDEQKTVGFYEDAIGTNPVVGWLVCVEGNHYGEDFRLVVGKNFIGRSPAMDVKLSGDSTVSRERHAAVVYEPKSNIFLIQSGSSKELSYLNDEVVLESKQLKTNDIITVGATKLMFIPCCSAAFSWPNGENESK